MKIRGVSDANEPAFPVITKSVPSGEIVHFSYTGGLTKREKLAGMALMGLLADSNCSGEPEKYASNAVLLADALLKELAR